MAAKGYPGNYNRGSTIEGLDAAAQIEGVEIFHAGTKADGSQIVANGGRVLNVLRAARPFARRRPALMRPSIASIGPTALPLRHWLARHWAGEINLSTRDSVTEHHSVAGIQNRSRIGGQEIDNASRVAALRRCPFERRQIEFRLPPTPRFIFVVHGTAAIGDQPVNEGEAWQGETGSRSSQPRPASRAERWNSPAAIRAPSPPTRRHDHA